MAVPACFIILLSLILEEKTYLQLKFNIFSNIKKSQMTTYYIRTWVNKANYLNVLSEFHCEVRQSIYKTFIFFVRISISLNGSSLKYYFFNFPYEKLNYVVAVNTDSFANMKQILKLKK